MFRRSFFCHYFKHNSIMSRSRNLLIIKLIILFNLLIYQNIFADNHNIYETLEKIQKDIKTLEKAVYSGSIKQTTIQLIH